MISLRSYHREPCYITSHYYQTMWFLLTAVLATCLLFSAAQAGTIIENFDNGQFNSNLFTINIEGTGPAVAVASKRLEITLPATSAPSSGRYGGYLGLQSTLTGDFDAQVDFNLLTWPSVGAAAGIMANNCEVARRYYAVNDGGEIYEAWLNGVDFKVSTSDRTGTLRLKRTGTTMQAFYLNAAGWQLIGSITNPQLGGEVILV